MGGGWWGGGYNQLIFLRRDTLGLIVLVIISTVPPPSYPPGLGGGGADAHADGDAPKLSLGGVWMPHTDRYQSCLLERASTCERGGGYENGGVAPLSANFFPRRVRRTSRAERTRDGVDGAECTRKVRRKSPVLDPRAREHRRQPAPRHLTHGELPGRSLSLEARGLGLSADPRARSAPRRRRARLPGVGTAALHSGLIGANRPHSELPT